MIGILLNCKKYRQSLNQDFLIWDVAGCKNINLRSEKSKSSCRGVKRCRKNLHQIVISVL
jgi:hypothetical protein